MLDRIDLLFAGSDVDKTKSPLPIARFLLIVCGTKPIPETASIKPRFRLGKDRTIAASTVSLLCYIRNRGFGCSERGRQGFPLGGLVTQSRVPIAVWACRTINTFVLLNGESRLPPAAHRPITFEGPVTIDLRSEVLHLPLGFRRRRRHSPELAQCACHGRAFY
jgi:hypothetical protein